MAESLDSLMAAIVEASKAKDVNKVKELTKQISELQRSEGKAKAAKRDEHLESFKDSVSKAAAAIVGLQKQAAELDIKRFGIVLRQGEDGKYTADVIAGAKAARGSGGGGHKFAISTAELIKKYGNDKDAEGKTWSAKYEAAKATDKESGNGNAVYFQVRVPLIKKEGLVK